MIDWHSHVLPGVDDGSRDLTESILMLTSLGEQGVEYVVATPHFLANNESVEDFLIRRDAAHTLLCNSLPPGAPKVLRGAEVKYYSGISNMVGLERLTVQNTRLLLLEMPMTHWTDYTVKEIIQLANASTVKPILAHFERYLQFQNEKSILRLLDNGVLMQVNASFFINAFSRGKALKFLESGRIHFIGSDAHNMTSRPPRLGEAYGLIEKKLGEDYVYQMNEYGHDMLKI